jgi:hypothetical protein
MVLEIELEDFAVEVTFTTPTALESVFKSAFSTDSIM